MKWSMKAGQLAGIDIRIHATFLLLLGWIGAGYWTTSKTLHGVISGIAFILAVFVCVVLHELGHALAARRFGIKTRDITLLPIGGIARLERMPEKPKQELWIALAGPAVNLAIAGLLYAWLVATHEWEPLSYLKVATGPFVERLFVANLSLTLFNLIPAFPMDGGRVLRALLALRTTYANATRLAASVGQGLALVFGLTGLFTDPMLLIVGLLVWFGASQEAGAAQMKSALSGMPTSTVMLTEFETLHAGDRLADAAGLSLTTLQRDFPVIETGRVVGMLTRFEMLNALAEFGDDCPIFLVMRREFPAAQSSESLDVVFERLQENAISAMPVFRNEWLVGLVTTESMGEYLLIDATLGKLASRRGFVRRVGPQIANPRDPARTGPLGDSVSSPRSATSGRAPIYP